MARGLKERLRKKKLETLKKSFYDALLVEQGALTDFTGKSKYVVFLSARDGEEKATVVHAIANSFEASWKNASHLLRKVLSQKKMRAKWLKADLVTSVQEHEVDDFLVDVKVDSVFDKGIALDRMFNTAFLAEEVSENQFLQGMSEGTPRLSFAHINQYRKVDQFERFSLKEEQVKQLYTFQTASFYTDDTIEEPVRLDGDGLVSDGCIADEKEKYYQLINELYAIPSLKRNVMPLHAIETKEEMIHYVTSYPATTLQLEDEFVLMVFRQSEDQFILIQDEEIYEVSLEQLMDFLPNPTSFLFLQQYVQSVTELGMQHKLVIELSQIEQQWQFEEHSLHINIEGGVSFDEEGAVASIEVEPFILRNYPTQAYDLLTTIELLMGTMIRYLNSRPSLLTDHLTVVIGIDVDGTPWIERIVESI